MLSSRKENILKALVGEHLIAAAPVSSEVLWRKHHLGVSPATIRNEMAELEEEGYLEQPHTSAGRIPSDRGYRYYIEVLMEETEVPEAQRLLIRHQFHQVEKHLEEWVRLAGAVLSRSLRNMALITLPKAAESRLKRIELVSLQDFLALLVLLLQETKLKQQMVAFEEATSQEQLSALANKINALYGGLTRSQIHSRAREVPPTEGSVIEAVVHLMEAEDAWEYEEPYFEGVGHLVNQPEFSTRKRMQEVVEVVEEKTLLRSLLPQLVREEGVQVVMGSETGKEAMRGFSMVVTRYGVLHKMSGALGVLGPTRMPYDKAIPAVRYLAALMTELTSEICS